MGYLADYFLAGKPNAFHVLNGPWQLYNALSLASLELNDPPADDYLLMITVMPSGTHTNCGTTKNPGHIIINGKENLQFTGADKRPNNTTINGTVIITTSDLDCGILIECTTTGGSPIMQEVLIPIEILVKQKTRRLQTAPGVFTVTNYDVETEAKLGINDVIRFNDPFRDGELHDIVVRNAESGLNPMKNFQESFRLLNCF